MTGERRPEPGERCGCGAPAVVVYLTEHGEVPYCGVPKAAPDPDVRALDEFLDGGGEDALVALVQALAPYYEGPDR